MEKIKASINSSQHVGAQWLRALYRSPRTARKKLLALVPLKPLIKHKAPGPLVFFVHGIGHNEAYVNRLYRQHSVATFSAMMDRLLKHFRPLEDLSIESILGARPDQFIATFDDGLRSTYELAVPILERKGVPAIFFLNPQFIDNRRSFHRFEAALLLEALDSASDDTRETIRRILSEGLSSTGDVESAILSVRYPERAIYKEIAGVLGLDLRSYFQAERPFLTTREVRDLQSRGFHLGAHSLDHPKYSEISEEEQVAQTVESVDEIVMCYGLGYRYFAFPFNRQGVAENFYSQTAGHVDVYFTTDGWRQPEMTTRIVHRIGLDAVANPIPAAKRSLLKS